MHSNAIFRLHRHITIVSRESTFHQIQGYFSVISVSSEICQEWFCVDCSQNRSWSMEKSEFWHFYDLCGKRSSTISEGPKSDDAKVI